MARAGLLVIDHQPAFAHPDSPWFCPALAEVTPRIGRLVAHFGDRVLFTRFLPPAVPVGSWLQYYQLWDFALQPGGEWLWPVSAPWADRPSIASHTFSKWNDAARAFFGPDPEVVMCGVATDCCVLGTAFAAVDDGVQVRLVADACAAASPAVHQAAVDLMASRAPQLSVVSAAEILG